MINNTILITQLNNVSVGFMYLDQFTKQYEAWTFGDHLLMTKKTRDTLIADVQSKNATRIRGTQELALADFELIKIYDDNNKLEIEAYKIKSIAKWQWHILSPKEQTTYAASEFINAVIEYNSLCKKRIFEGAKTQSIKKWKQCHNLKGKYITPLGNDLISMREDINRMAILLLDKWQIHEDKYNDNFLIDDYPFAFDFAEIVHSM